MLLALKGLLSGLAWLGGRWRSGVPGNLLSLIPRLAWLKYDGWGG